VGLNQNTKHSALCVLAEQLGSHCYGASFAMVRDGGLDLRSSLTSVKLAEDGGGDPWTVVPPPFEHGAPAGLVSG